MEWIQSLVPRIEAGYEVCWYGAAGEEHIAAVERALGVELPAPLEAFIKERGGGGVVGADVSGVLPNADSNQGGTLLADTLRCRSRYGLPSHLVVIYLHDDEVCCGVDASKREPNPAPVVSYDVCTRGGDGVPEGSASSQPKPASWAVVDERQRAKKEDSAPAPGPSPLR